MRKGKLIQVRLENTDSWVSLADLVKAKIGKTQVREVAKKVGIGHSTLWRVANRNLDPDMSTFGKIWEWLELGISGVRREP